jgi:hypothetical protein
LLTSTSILVKVFRTPLSEPSYLRLHGQIRDKRVDPSTVGCPELGGRGVGAIAVPSGDGDVGAHGGQA